MTRKRWLKERRYAEARKRTATQLPKKLLSTQRKIKELSSEMRTVGLQQQAYSHESDFILLENTVNNLDIQMKSMQYRMGQLKIEERLLRKLTATGAPAPEQLREEFASFYALHGVYSVDVVNINGDMTLCLDVAAEVQYFSRVYDLGNWRFSINLDLVDFGSQSLRSAVRDGWAPGSYPSYALPDGSFCFGTNFDIIKRSIEVMNYVQAANVAVGCFNGVNEDDESSIPKAFYEKRVV